MEEQSESLLLKMADRLELYPELESRIRQHAPETRQQLIMVKSVLDRHNASHSVLKDISARTAALVQSAIGLCSSNEILKNSISGYTF
jgi:ferritin-like metal-binding protein YciE